MFLMSLFAVMFLFLTELFVTRLTGTCVCDVSCDFIVKMVIVHKIMRVRE